jgi:endogenous inhibitor of DNA gyrase (YacG/DUF329 family)
MAKVIGFDPKLMKQCKCRKCAAIVKYSEHEVQSYVEHDYGGGKDLVKFIKCPSCGNDVRL